MNLLTGSTMWPSMRNFDHGGHADTVAVRQTYFAGQPHCVTSVTPPSFAGVFNTYWSDEIQVDADNHRAKQR